MPNKYLRFSVLWTSIFHFCFHLETITTEIFHPRQFPMPGCSARRPFLHLPFGFNKIFHNSLGAFAIDTCWCHLPPFVSVCVLGRSFSPGVLCPMLCSRTRRWKFTLRMEWGRCTTVSFVVRWCPQDLSLASSTMPGADDGPMGGSGRLEWGCGPLATAVELISPLMALTQKAFTAPSAVVAYRWPPTAHPGSQPLLCAFQPSCHPAMLPSCPFASCSCCSGMIYIQSEHVVRVFFPGVISLDGTRRCSPSHGGN